ncbi:unnamed protein product [Kluyveromyces dobzhanskii CBS 2104]|uniref:Peroxisomal membrane protein PEX13 n=1 Tax=Kluyveromyces dobzhanskii CBS 2104 TaxID=1427455 RepID=A0A0A8L7E9_9SACH|nr:unnamed protein product [Kluyveromyces dobzhanskii CBS 2104]
MSQSSGVARPKPWEQKGGADSSVADTNLTESGTALQQTDGQPSLPSKPTGLNGDLDTLNGGNALRNGMSGYGSIYGGGMGSGYGIGSMMGGGYGSMYGGGYGSMYGGGYGSMYGGGYGSMNGMNGMNGGPTGIAESTQATFQLIEGLIGAVVGFSQMLEATYMATHNSFFTMITVAEQFQYMKELLGSFFGIFALMKFVKKILYRVTGGKMGVAPSKKRLAQGNENNQVSTLSKQLIEEFKSKNSDPSKKKGKRMSWKPLIMFLAAVFGFPYILNKFIQKLQQHQKARVSGGTFGEHNLDPNNLEFARAIYDFVPENPRIECNLKKGDLMAIISKKDPMGNNSEWWKVRTKQGNIGYVPYNYLELIKKRKVEVPIEPKSSKNSEDDTSDVQHLLQNP